MNKIKQILVITILILPTVLFSTEEKDKFALGISLEETGTPIIRTKFKVYKNFSLEPRLGLVFVDGEYSNFNSVLLLGTRVYFKLNSLFKNFKKTENWIYTGIEADYLILYQTMGPFGNGYVLGYFLGAEKYVSNRLAVSLDFGPYYISAKHKNFDIKEEGLDFIINFFINFYLF